jgi:hypothetical protein
LPQSADMFVAKGGTPGNWECREITFRGSMLKNALRSFRTERLQAMINDKNK